MESENFPRGGKKIVHNNVTGKRKPEDNLFYVERPTKPKKPRKDKLSGRNEGNNEELWQASLRLQGTLTYNKIHEGLVVQCCVRHISNLTVQVEFPGLTFGVVTINCISDAFTKLLTQKLEDENESSCMDAVKDILQIGQLVPAKILSVKETENGHEVEATIKPKDINAERAHYSFKRGALVWANVVSELEHGYELSAGVSNCRVFLPHKYIEEGVTYEIGTPLYCVVQKIEITSAVSTLTVSSKKNHIDKNQQDADLSLSDVIPGTQVEFLVQEITKHGIKGQFLDDCFGYIDETQIFSKFEMSNLLEGSTLKAYVLYIEPITKVTYLTMRGLDSSPQPSYEVGKIMTAEIVSVVPKGVYLKLGKDSRGFVTNKRLLKTLPNNAQLDIGEAIKKKYPVGNKQECRILDYNHLEQFYVCTFEKRIIQEKVFSANDLSIGDKVTVKIEKIVENGLVVKSGHVQGFVTNFHISNAKFSPKVKAKFRVGMEVDARVLNVTDSSVFFTLKPALVNSQTCLKNIEDVEFKTQYEGYVVQTKLSGALVAFYGNVTGWISKKMLNSDSSCKNADPREYFFPGQVIKVYVAKIKDNKLKLSLHLLTVRPKKEVKKKTKIGDILSGVITKVNTDGVKVEVGPSKIEGIVPVAHLSPVAPFCPLLLKLYKTGRQIKKLMLLRKANSYVMSRREAIVFARNSLVVPKLQEIKKDMTLRCSFLKKMGTGILVSTPISNHHGNIVITNNNIKYRKGQQHCFEKEETVLAKVLNIDYDTKKIDLGLNLRDDPNHVQSAFDNLCDVIGEFNHISYYLNTRKCSKLTEYKIGERVICKVNKIESNGTQWVSLPNGVEGKIVPDLTSKAAVGSTVEGVVLDYNFFDDYVEICTKQNIKGAVNKTQDGVIKKLLNVSWSMARILLVTNLYVLGVLKGGTCNGQLVYLPLELHNSGKNKNQMKVVISRRVGTKLIALPKKYFAAITDNKEAKIKSKNIEKPKIVQVDEDSKHLDTVGNFEEEVKVEIDDDDIENVDDYSDSDEYMENGDDHDGDSDEDIENVGDNDSDSDEEQEEQRVQQKTDSKNSEPVLSGAHSFYAADNEDLIKEESSSDDEEKNDDLNNKKKKLTKTERSQKAKQEEERISKIEKELADATLAPQSAEQFDRLLLANPNSSELWLQYMAMHVAATELEKARAVAKKAIDTINMTLVKEKFNVWIALLNLENMYGTKESFEKVLEDALKYNDSLEIYLSIIKMLASSGKLAEMEEKIKKVKSKEKQNTKMWLELGQVYYSLGKSREARNIKEAALKSILDKKRQFDLIVRFGIMEFQLGDFEQAVANFETILDTYPAKTNIWIIYVDQLVKLKKIDAARKVLERAVGQRLGLKPMKVLFQKFVAFEEQHGTAETVEDAKKRAREYVMNLSGR